jgi:mono/diheme cytochrome c family protein
MRMSLRSLSLSLVVVAFFSGGAEAQVSVDALVERGQEVYRADVGCWVCHGETAEGLLGPSLRFGPTPANIADEIRNNPVMGVVAAELDPSDEDLVAVSMYLRTLAELSLDADLPAQWRAELTESRARQVDPRVFVKTERDLAVEAIESFGSVLTGWERRAKAGSLLTGYDAKVVASWDPGEPKFEPQPNRTYFYESVGVNAKPAVMYQGYTAPESNQVVVGDAATKEVIASGMLPAELRGGVHTTVMSPDGRFVYIIGPRAPRPDGTPDPGGATTMIKVDALTLQPTKQITIGARLHHGQLFQNRYLLLDMFGRDPDGLAVMLYDPETDTVVGGATDVDLGGFVYTVWTDDDFIYALMEPAGYAPGRGSGVRGANRLHAGTMVALRPFWVAKIDPNTWEVVKEYPLPGYRGNWAVIDASKEHIYVSMSGSSNVTKMNIETGAVVWTAGAGPGPYGMSLTADESEIWIGSKGENMGEFGRTISVLDAETGRPRATLFAAYEMDHVLLSPSGTEMWATSNAEGQILVYDAASREQTHTIEMPGNGDPHGLVWVHYDAQGEPRVVGDQGGHQGGVNPATGSALSY